MTSARFLADLRQNLVKGDKALEDKLQLDRWVYQPGLPGNVARPDPAAFADVDKAVARFAGGGPLDAMAWGAWTTAERLRFLNKLPRKLPKARLDALERGFGLNTIGNNEVRFAWLDLAIAQPLRSGRPEHRAVRHQPGPPQVREAADHRPCRGHRLGPADRPAHLSQGAAALSPDHDQGPGQAGAGARARPPELHPAINRDLERKSGPRPLAQNPTEIGQNLTALKPSSATSEPTSAGRKSECTRRRIAINAWFRLACRAANRSH